MNKGDCAGACPVCEKELLGLTQFFTKLWRGETSLGKLVVISGKILNFATEPRDAWCLRGGNRVLGGSFTYGKAFTYALFLGYSKPEKF